MILLVEQSFELAYRLADRVVALRRGEIVLSGAPDTFEKSELLSVVSV